MRNLTAQEIDDFSKAFARIMNQNQLERLVHLATGEVMYEAYVPPTLLVPMRGLIRHLLMELEKEPLTDRFMHTVYWEFPGQTNLRQAIAAVYPEIAGADPVDTRQYSVQKGGQTLQPAGAALPGLQTVVKKRLKFLPIRVWLERVGRIERQVCRIESKEKALGTGFLVGPSAVLTNWHVVQKARNENLLAGLSCRFDFRLLPDGRKDPGLLCPVKSILDEKPCSPAELGTGPAGVSPTAGELDYALLQLEQSQEARGHLALLDPPPVTPDDPLMIVQHPSGDPLDFTLDTDAVIGKFGDGRRLRYRTNTLPGSSGSPCLSMDLDLLALHHLGDPGQGNAAFNQGIPIDLVRASIIGSGYGIHLGG